MRAHLQEDVHKSSPKTMQSQGSTLFVGVRNEELSTKTVKSRLQMQQPTFDMMQGLHHHDKPGKLGKDVPIDENVWLFIIRIVALTKNLTNLAPTSVRKLGAIVNNPLADVATMVEMLKRLFEVSPFAVPFALTYNAIGM